MKKILIAILILIFLFAFVRIITSTYKNIKRNNSAQAFAIVRHTVI